MPYVPAEEEKLKALDDVFYEIQQLLGTMRPQIGAAVLDNAVLESRLLHVRNLIDFFANDERPQDDILAAHYGFSSSPVNFDPVFYERLNKDLVHLTYSRTSRTASDRAWPVTNVVVPALSRCKEFIDYMLHERTIFATIGASDWRALGLSIDAFLDSPVARQGI